ncbi:hypothetical protein [Schlesneria sp.]|uniref:hypothetical protein n=1 Tax=Schlesneria sp. TaxID=2762018 RepID=UPI003F7EE77A
MATKTFDKVRRAEHRKLPLTTDWTRGRGDHKLSVWELPVREPRQSFRNREYFLSTLVLHGSVATVFVDSVILPRDRQG